MQFNPLDFNGTTFLIFYVIVLALGLGIQILLRHWLWTPSLLPDSSGKPRKPLSVYQLAFLRGGELAVAQVGIVELLNRGWIEAHVGLGRFRAVGETNRQSLTSLDDVPLTLMHACQSGDGLLPGKIRSELKFSVQRIKNQLELLGLVPSSLARFSTLLSSFVVFGSIVGLGIAKIVIGLERGKPVEFLIVLVVVAAILGIVLATSRRINALGREQLEDSRRELASSKPNKKDESSMGNHLFDQVSLATLSVAVLGLTAVGGQDFVDPNSKSLLQRAEASAGAGSSGCGSAGCGGGSSGGDGGGCGGGGGGCGGGGCGGCGS
jgi:uncharacterized protein (TIGR04222 family)